MTTRFFILLLALIALLFAVCVKSSAQQYQFSQGTYLTVATNSGTLATTTFQQQVNPIALSILCTNSATVITNVIVTTITATNSMTFVYSASTMGTNFSTNFNNGNPLSLSVTTTTYGLAIPQSGGTNTATIK